MVDMVFRKTLQFVMIWGLVYLVLMIVLIVFFLAPFMPSCGYIDTSTLWDLIMTISGFYLAHIGLNITASLSFKRKKTRLDQSKSRMMSTIFYTIIGVNIVIAVLSSIFLISDMNAETFGDILSKLFFLFSVGLLGLIGYVYAEI